MKKRLVSMILSAVLFATSVPVAAFAEDANTQNPVVHSEEGTSQGSNARKESGIDYKKNGGTFAEGYTAPSNYDEPVTELPGAEQITKAGYEFAGWYDNEEFNGEPVTSLSTAGSFRQCCPLCKVDGTLLLCGYSTDGQCGWG